MFKYLSKLFENKDCLVAFIFGGLFMFICLCIAQIFAIAKLAAKGVNLFP